MFYNSKKITAVFISLIMAISVLPIMAISVLPISAFANNSAEDDNIYEEYLEDDDTVSSEDNAELTDDNNDTETSSLDASAGASNNEKTVTLPAKQIKLTCGQRHTLLLGETLQITTSLKPRKSDDYLIYKSYNRSVALVSEDGLITAVGYGDARIRIKASSGVKTNIYIKVRPVETDYSGPVQSIAPVDENIMLRSGDTAQIQYLCYPLGSYEDVTYQSSDDSVVSVSHTGKINGLKDGSAVITLTSESGLSASCTVTVYSGVYRGIDVSKWQGKINWAKVKNAGVDFAMIRSSFGDSDVDIQLKNNVAGCEKYNIPYGFYHYTYATNVSEARKEARFMLKTIKNYNPEYPIVLDIEDDLYKKMSKKKITNIICAFMEEIEAAGYYATVYSYATFLTDYVNMDVVSKYNIWVASWGDTDKLNASYSHQYGMWQYSSTGKISGINGDVDLNYAYKEYRSIIRKKGFNNL